MNEQDNIIPQIDNQETDFDINAKPKKKYNYTKKTGRPKQEFDWKVFEACCKLMATKDELSNVLGVSCDVIEFRTKEKYGKTFSQVLDSLASGTKISLRRTQLLLAKKSTPMAIWLGKQYLGQSEKMEVVSQEYINQEIEIVPSNSFATKEDIENRVKVFLK